MRKMTKHPFCLTILSIAFFVVLFFIFYVLWTPGLNVKDGRYDLHHNGIWIQHGWLGDDEWFARNQKQERIPFFRDSIRIWELASQLRKHHITDVFPHLCPTLKNGRIPSVDNQQTELFLKKFEGFRVMPWVGGVLNKHIFPGDSRWRRNFRESILDLLRTHPKFYGVHINIEPWPSGNQDIVTLLEEVRKILPKGKILSVAAFPPPTFWQPTKGTHWDKAYFRRIAELANQMVVMMYDTSIKYKKFYQHLMASWTKKILDWTQGTAVLLGVPSYKDEGVGYHNPDVENLSNSLRGIYAGLSSFKKIPSNYQGISLYCEWEMDESEWQYLRKHFLKP